MRQFAHLKEGVSKGEKSSPQLRQNASLPRERAIGNKHGDDEYHAKLNVGEKPAHASVTESISKPLLSARSLLKSESISASKCIGEKPRQDREVSALSTHKTGRFLCFASRETLYLPLYLISDLSNV
ncbi:hypothetical protein GUJ93_ZPchr0005g15838 [Zizania palustris]|uniref:Uncharacterized protein n=1 Tax=Zizania palustris TaxID=103762 RepID=A0A8J5W171_ZIZPA|nr:hypothetical protein GUJ93_ZPchr0005g15838 [Zizania palustris]